MISRSFNISILIRLLLILGLAVGLGIFISKGNVILIIFISIILLILSVEIIRHFNVINRKLSYFFDAVRNEDSTLHFSEKISDKSTRELHKSLNRLNSLISEIKINNEYNERFYRELLRYSATGLIAVDDKGYIELINDAALRFLGLTSIAHLRLLEQKQKEVYEELLQLKPGQTRTLKLLRDQGIQQLSVKVAYLKFGTKSYKVYSLYDIKLEMEENELESWQKLIRVLTHEIMNSIAPITSLSNTLQRFLHTSGPEAGGDNSGLQIDKALEGLQVIEETGKGLMHFTDNYRKLTKVPKPLFKPVNVREWLGRIDLLMKDKLNEEGILLDQRFTTRHKEFPGDEKLLSQVMINILNNSIDALKGCRKRIIILNAADDKQGRLEVTVTDFGKGIRPADLDKVFIPFYTTKEHGSGIGLSISRQIMRLHKGSISVQSAEGKQTTTKLNF